MSHAELERKRIELRTAIADEKQRHEKTESTLRADLIKVESQIASNVAGVDQELMRLAESVMYVNGVFAKAGQDRVSQLECAIRDLLNGCAHLREQYYGTKDYASWHGQASDHTYGYGPKHGSIIFRIGLLEPVRKREGTVLEESEVEACVYYLRNIERIQAAHAAGELSALSA